MAELFKLELDEDVALEDAMVEHQIDEAVLVADQDALLASFEAEAVPQFQKEFLEMVEKLLFEVRFANNLAWFQAQELEDVRVAHGEGRRSGLGLGMGGGSELAFVLGEGGSLEVKAGDLSPELAHRPVSADAFAGVKIPLLFVVQIHNQFQVAVG